MNPFTLLKEDHKKVKELFKEFEAAGDRAYRKKQDIAEQICNELEVHATVEEEIFYPAVRKNSDDEAVELVLESYEEHLIVKRLIQEIRGLEAQDERFDAKMKVLMENVEHHVKEEENELFPQAKSDLGDQAEELAEQMQERKDELQGALV